MLRKGPTRLIIETTKEMLSLLPKYITYCHSGNSLEATQEVREQSTTIGKAKKTILNLPLQEKSHKGGKNHPFFPHPCLVTPVLLVVGFDREPAGKEEIEFLSVNSHSKTWAIKGGVWS